MSSEPPYPRFSDAEMARRRAAVAALLEAHDADHLVVYGANRVGSAVGWLTRWPVTREALDGVYARLRPVIGSKSRTRLRRSEAWRWAVGIRRLSATLRESAFRGVARI
jgi:hypothetical protein